MGRFTSLTKKTYKIISIDEARNQFPEMIEDIIQTPLDYVYLVIYDERPTPKPIPPQLLGPYPKEIAEDSVKDLEENHRSALMYSRDNVVKFQPVLKIGDDKK